MTSFEEGRKEVLKGVRQFWNRYQTKAGWHQILFTLALIVGGLSIAIILLKAFSPHAGMTEPVGLVELGIRPSEPEPAPEPEATPLAMPEPDICSEQREAERQLDEFMQASEVAKQEISRLILEIADSRGQRRKDWYNLQALESEENDTGLDQLLQDFAGTASSFNERLEDGALSTDANVTTPALQELTQMLEMLDAAEAYLKDNSRGRLDFVIASDVFTRVDTAYRQAKAFENRRQFDLARMEDPRGCRDVDTEGLD